MRILFKVLLFPVSLALTIFVAVCSFLIHRIAFLLNILSGILLIAALLGLLQYLVGWPFGGARMGVVLQSTIIAGITAFLLSPFGLPKTTAWVVLKLDDLNGVIKSI